MNRSKIIKQLRKKDVFIITHIPKTSGSSLSYLLSKQKPDIFWPHYEKTNNVPRYISGHMCYGVHNKWGLDNSRVKYITILRDPVKRWKSVFDYALMRYHQGNIKSGMVVFFETCGGSIEKFLEWCLNNGSNRDVMTKIVSGVEDTSNIDGYKDSYKKKGKLYFSQMGQTAWAKRSYKISKEKMDDMLDIAKNNLLKKYHFVGFMEDGENQNKICKALGIRSKKKQVFRRKSIKNKKISWDSKTITDMLIELNSYDIKMYNYAVDNMSDF